MVGQDVVERSSGISLFLYDCMCASAMHMVSSYLVREIWVSQQRGLQGGSR